MVRKSVLAVLLALGSLPLTVHGIGLGDIKTHSALNQNFRGEIQLLSVPQGDLDTMRVKLASREAFAKTGSEYLHVLSQLKFDTARRKDGSAVILVTSNEAIREPFLDFLVEVNWPNGRLVKEYTVLLDPPVTTKRRAPEISKPKVSIKKKAAPAPEAPATPATSKSKTTASATPNMYGPVAANETTWKIAAKLKPQGISIHQMMMALLQANPRAFVNNNVNRLKKGSMLRVPSVDEIKAFNRQDAITSFKQQTDDWKANITRTTDAPEPAPVEADAGADVVEPQPVKADEEARLQIAAARPEGDGEAGASETDIADDASGEELRHELMLAREKVETSRLETNELKATVNEMAAQLEEMKRLLVLQDEQLAQLRARVIEGEEASAASAGAPSEQLPTAIAVEPDAPSDQDQEPAETSAIGESETAEVAPMVEPDPAEADTAIAAEPAGTAATTEPESAELDTSVVAETAEAKTPSGSGSESAEEVAGKEPQSTTVPEKPVETVTDRSQQPSWLEENLTMLAAAAGGLFGIGVLGALFRGHRRKQLLVEEPDTANEEALPSVPDHKTDATGQDAADQEKTFADKFPPADKAQEADETASEVDPVAAADVYIAYDRFAEAQKILENEIAAGNDSLPVRNKLLEVYFKTDNQQGFAAVADKMVQEGLDKKDSESWEHIQGMGKKLDKFNPLFWTSVSKVTTPEVSELNLDIGKGGTDSAGKDDEDSLGELDNLELDLSSFGMDGIGESQEIPGSNTLTDEDEQKQAFAESGMDVEVADLSALDEITPSETDKDTGESSEEISFAEPLENIEIGDEADTKLELARAYMDMGDNEGAVSILKEVMEEGSDDQITAASELISQLNS